MTDAKGQGSRACDPAAWDFARAEELWDLFSPLTPGGKDAKESRTVLGDRERIEELYDETEAALAALASLDGPSRDRLTYRLGRLPRLPEGLPSGADRAFEAIDIFLVKRFLVNYRAILDILDEGVKSRFALVFESEALFALLGIGGSDEESFFVSDAYDPELASIRERIRSADSELALAQEASELAAEEERGLRFRGRSFLLISADAARALLSCEASVRFSVEPYDSASCCVRLLPGEAELRAEAEREGLLAEEREIEGRVLASLSRSIAAAADRISAYEEASIAFDLARARAVLASRLRSCRPALGSERFAIAAGRLVPCEADCARLSLRYRPLDLELEEKAALVFGSNMGGKTVALQTALCLQILAQAGFFVPAERFETRVYARIIYAGAPRPGSIEPGRDEDGLSGFGREVDALGKAWAAAKEGGAFVVLDELGRTTSSSEAEALVASASEAFAAARATRCLMATHFCGASPSGSVARLRMAGLDREAARVVASDGALTPGERIRRIGGLMRYEIIREEGRGGAAKRDGSDALAVAALLGLDEAILSGARVYYSERHGDIEGDGR